MCTKIKMSSIKWLYVSQFKAKKTSMSTLEEFFSDDFDTPVHFICSLTETIFVEPALLNGRIYEKSKILDWIKTNKTGKYLNSTTTNHTTIYF